MNYATVRNAEKQISNNPRAYNIIANGGEFSDLRTNNTLRRDEWLRIDDEVLSVSRQNLNAVQDIRDAGLVDPIDIGVTVSAIEKSDAMAAAEVTISGEANPQEDRQDITRTNYPVPFVQKGFRISARTLRASRTRGDSLDVSQASEAARLVSEQLEDIVFNGNTDAVVSGDSIPGFTTETNRNTVSGSDWGTTSNCIPNVNSAITALLNDGYNGPYMMYVANTQWGELKAPLGSGTSDTPFDELLARPEIMDIKPSGKLTDEAVVVEMSRDVVDMQIAEDIQTIEWESGSGRTAFFLVSFVGVPRVKSTSAGDSGVAHITGI